MSSGHTKRKSVYNCLTGYYPFRRVWTTKVEVSVIPIFSSIPFWSWGIISSRHKGTADALYMFGPDRFTENDWGINRNDS